MIEFLCVITVIAAGIWLYVLEQSTKKADWVKQDAKESADAILKKHSADVISPDQAYIAKMLAEEIEAHLINDVFDDVNEADRLSKIDS